ncbi:hypothetical protein PHYBOEH_007018 [Phytophthora boehmeriae]|uniref:Phosphatidylinositol N-acetylglucosaminyltransferase subunit Q n=1 Tax=Phytophthora boehmeriae TaxID=109152 RepID=A0A8T1X1J2_9STRA|nr:hypothetical protein PHYBOEH_007018 [Phytophthora boehmeriae]
MVVVYWPRHLWTSEASVASPACVRLSPDAVCVVAIDSEASSDLQLFPPDSKSRRIVLFDAEVAALGGFSSLHSPQLLERIGRQFADQNNEEKAKQQVKERPSPTSKGAAAFFKWLLETVAHYVISLPFALLLIVADAFQRTVKEFQMPSWMVAGGDKSLADLSTFLAVFAYQLHNTASLPRKLRKIYAIREQRRLSRQEKAKLLEVCNWICFMLLDVVLGRLMFRYMSELVISTFQSAEISPITVINFLRDNVEWLMGAPAGFKLNKPLASILGNGILLWLDLWSFTFAELLPRCDVGMWLEVVFSYLGVTLQTTLLADLVNLTTWHLHWVYLYFAKLNRLQFGLFASLSKLFLGQKINVLRHRVDSCEYDVGQLLLGTLLFTILAFLVTTNLVFFVFFAAVRGTVVLISLTLWLPVVALSTLPLASLIYRVWTPHFFVIGMQLQLLDCSATTFSSTITLDNVGARCRKPQVDIQNRRALRRVFASWDTNATESCTGAYFELVPVVCYKYIKKA